MGFSKNLHGVFTEENRIEDVLADGVLNDQGGFEKDQASQVVKWFSALSAL